MTILEHERAADGTQRRVPTYQVLVEDIKALGVEQVFGLMSDDTAVFATALDSSGVRFYGARHENNAIAMAEGFSYATGGLGVAVEQCLEWRQGGSCRSGRHSGN